MGDFNSDIDNTLICLHGGRLAVIPTEAGLMISADATNDLAVHALLNASANNPQPVILIADQRDLLQFVSAPDLAVFDFIEELNPASATWFSGILGISEQLLDANRAAPIALVNDTFNYTLIKRFRKPLVVIPVDNGALNAKAGFVCSTHTSSIANGYSLYNFAPSAF
ncbi:hypothetical protein MD537_18085 [Flavihumibacter sediminis]|nr:hypothetical protein [Flavihumibacter sediminis]